MSYTTQKLPEDPIVIQTLHADFDYAREGDAGMAEALAMLDAQPVPIYYIFDIRAYAPTIQDIVTSVNWGGKRGNMPTFRHPNVLETIIVSHMGVVKLAAQGLKTATWGNTLVRVFDTPEEAVAYVREQTAS